MTYRCSFNSRSTKLYVGFFLPFRRWFQPCNGYFRIGFIQSMCTVHLAKDDRIAAVHYCICRLYQAFSPCAFISRKKHEALPASFSVNIARSAEPILEASTKTMHALSGLLVRQQSPTSKDCIFWRARAA